MASFRNCFREYLSPAKTADFESNPTVPKARRRRAIRCSMDGKEVLCSGDDTIPFLFRVFSRCQEPRAVRR